MNDLTVFNNPDFGEIRTVMINNEPWFVGKDVSDALGYSNNRKAIADHVDCEDKGVTICDTLGGSQEVTVINESGLYSLIFGSKLESAKSFKHWVTSEVLPSIRKTGAYKINRENIPLKEQVESLEAVADMLRMNDASKILMLDGFYKSYNIPTQFLPKYELNGSRQLKAATHLLKENGCDLSILAFNRLLVEHGYLETKKRPSSKGVDAKFKSLTEKGLKYGENAINPKNQKETQPLYYVDSFMDLYNIVRG